MVDEGLNEFGSILEMDICVLENGLTWYYYNYQQVLCCFSGVNSIAGFP